MSTTPDITGTAPPTLAELAASWSTGHRCASCRATMSRRWYHRRRAALQVPA